MYDTDQALIGAYARTSPENMGRVYKFVIATIQQPLETVAVAMADFEELGSDSRFAFSSKATALDWMAEGDNLETLYATAILLWNEAPNDDEAEHALLDLFASCPGLGLVKGGFMVQLIFGLAGCLDTHNIIRLGLTPSRFAASRYKGAKRAATRHMIREEYLEACRGAGGVMHLWNDWCLFVADLRPGRWADGEAVSRYHAELICEI